MAEAGGLAQGELAEQVAAAREVALSLVRWGADLGFEAAIEARSGFPAAAVSVLQSWSADATFTLRLIVSCCFSPLNFLIFLYARQRVRGLSGGRGASSWRCF